MKAFLTEFKLSPRQHLPKPIKNEKEQTVETAVNTEKLRCKPTIPIINVYNFNAVYFIQKSSLSSGLKADYFNQVHHPLHAQLSDYQQHEGLICSIKTAAFPKTAGREGNVDIHPLMLSLGFVQKVASVPAHPVIIIISKTQLRNSQANL